MVVKIVGVVINVVDVDVLKVVDLGGKIVEEIVIDVVVIIGENMFVCCMVFVEGDVVIFYVYNLVIDGMGKIGVFVVLKGGDEIFGKQVVMYIVVVVFQFFFEVDLDLVVVEKECSV